MKKLIYFVRHGQSLTNASDTHHGPAAPLTERGLEQARFVASRFAGEKIEAVYVSNMQRAQETGRAIAEALGMPVRELAELHEVRKPSFFVGEKKNAPLVDAAKRDMKEVVHERDARVHDEETFADVLERVRHVLSTLAQAKETRVVAVTHGDFLRHIFGFIALGDEFLPAHRTSLRDHLPTTNTGVTLCEYKNDVWKVRTWNDQAHLAETPMSEPVSDWL